MKTTKLLQSTIDTHMAFFWLCFCDLRLPDFRLLVTEHKRCFKLRDESFDRFMRFYIW